MRERVLTLAGNKPIVLVCPHGSDDTHTADITIACANKLKCYAVINQGFERCEIVDVDKDQANCNRIDHVTQPIVYEEFLEPLTKFTDRIVTKIVKNLYNGGGGHPFGSNWQGGSYGTSPADLPKALIIHVHGAGNIVHKEAGENVAMIVGYGAGLNHDSFSCALWKKDAFIHCASGVFEDAVYQGKGGGNYAGRSSNNMNQYFVRKSPSKWVDSLQLEFPFSVRETEDQAVLQGVRLSYALEELLKLKCSQDFNGTTTDASL